MTDRERVPFHPHDGSDISGDMPLVSRVGGVNIRDHASRHQSGGADELAQEFTRLAEATADGTSTTLEVTGIPQTHRDLLVICHGSNDGTALRGVRIRFNGDTAANYRALRVTALDNGNPVRGSEQSATSMLLGSFGDDALLSQFRMEVADYTESSGNRGVTWQLYGTAGSSAGFSQHTSGGGSYDGTAALTQITATMTTDNWRSGSKLKVYGLGLA